MSWGGLLGALKCRKQLFFWGSGNLPKRCLRGTSRPLCMSTHGALYQGEVLKLGSRTGYEGWGWKEGQHFGKPMPDRREESGFITLS